MAKVRYINPVSEVSGSMGNVVHSRNRYGPYTREKTKKAYVMTEGRKQAHSNMEIAAKAYNTLTDRQITIWSQRLWTFTVRNIKKGKDIKTPRGLFIHVNKSLLEIGEPIRKEAPNMEAPGFIISMQGKYIKNDGNEDIKVYFNEPIREDTKVILLATKPLMRGNFKIDRSEYKEIDILDCNFKSGNTITSKYKKKYESLGEDTYKIGFMYREVHRISGLSDRFKEFTVYFHPEEEV